MATLEKIRNKAGLLVGAVGLALFAFIIGDGLRSGSTFFQGSRETVLSLDGQTVKIDEYSRRVEEVTQIYMMNSGNNLTEEQQVQVRNEVFETIVREILVAESSDKVGYAVTSEEMFDLFQGDNVSPMIQQMFQNENGQLDKAALLRFLQMTQMTDTELRDYPEQERLRIENSRKYRLFIEKNIKQQKLEEKLGSLISNAIVVNKLDAKAAFDESQGSVDFNYIVKSYATIPDSLVSVSNAEIETLYKKRKESYKQEPAVDIKYITLTVNPSEEDYAEVEKALEVLKPEFVNSESVADVVNDNSDAPFYDAYASIGFLSEGAASFVRSAEVGTVQGPVLIGNTYHLFKYLGKTTAPDSIKVNELTMPPMAEADMKVLADSLLGVINGGKAFAELAVELSGGRTNGDAGWMTDEQALRRYDDKFRNAISNANINEAFVLKSSRGTHIVQVTEKTLPVEKYKVADLVVSVVPSNTTLTDAYTKLSQYTLKNNKLDIFESEATAAGYVCLKNTVYSTQQSVAGIPSSRSIVRWAFNSKKGDTSEIFEFEGNRYAVAMVEAVLEKGYRPINTVAEILKSELINDKKAEIIMVEAQGLKCDSLQQCADVWNVPVQSVKFVNFSTPSISGIGVEPALNYSSSVAELNQITGPVKGSRGVFLIQVTDKMPAAGEFNVEQQKQNMNLQNSYRYLYMPLSALREKADIEDNRARFY